MDKASQDYYCRFFIFLIYVVQSFVNMIPTTINRRSGSHDNKE